MALFFESVKRIIDNEHERVGLWIQEHGGGFFREGTKCIGLEKDGQLVAGVMYDFYNGASVYAHIAAVGKHWLDREYLWFLFYYAFEQLKVNVILGLVASNNLQARRFDEHLGFKLLVEIPDADPDGSTLLYTMRKQDCRWLNIRRKTHEQTKSSQYA